jgi:hypothetical protein
MDTGGLRLLTKDFTIILCWLPGDVQIASMINVVPLDSKKLITISVKICMASYWSASYTTIKKVTISRDVRESILDVLIPRHTCDIPHSKQVKIMDILGYNHLTFF